MIVGTMYGNIFKDVNELQAIKRNEHIHSSDTVDEAMAHTKGASYLFPISFKTKSQLDDFIVKVESIYNESLYINTDIVTKEKSLNNEFKEGIEYALKLMKKDKSEKD